MCTFRHIPTDKRFFFIHIPRTAGRFIESNLMQNNNFEWDDHRKIDIVKMYQTYDGIEVDHFHRDHYEKYLDIEGIPHVTIVRNPLDRFISGSRYIKKMYGDDIQELMEDENYFYSMLTNFPLSESVNWYRSQLDFITNKTNIWRFEDGFGEEFVSWLSGTIGIDLEFTDDVEYPRHSDKGSTLEPTPKLLHNVRHLYRKEIERFYPELAAPL